MHHGSGLLTFLVGLLGLNVSAFVNDGTMLKGYISGTPSPLCPLVRKLF